MSKELHWDEDCLRNAEGQTVAHHWPYKHFTEWVVLTIIDPKDNTRGTSQSVAAARKRKDGKESKRARNIRKRLKRAAKRGVRFEVEKGMSHERDRQEAREAHPAGG